MKQIIVDDTLTNYGITENGECYNLTTGKQLKGQISNSGYLNFNLTLPDGTEKRFYAHRLVATMYIPNSRPEATQVNHIDCDKLNNSVSNLEWTTPQENTQHALTNNCKIYKPVYQFNSKRELIEIYTNRKEVVDKCGFNESLISQALNETTKTLFYNYYWSYEPEIINYRIIENHGQKKAVCQYDLQGNLIAEYESGNEAGRINNCGGNHIRECCNGKIKTYKGYIWRYKEDIV